MKISNLYILLFTLFIFACYSSKSKVKKNQKKETLELEPIVNSQFYKYIDQYDKESIYEKDEQVVAVIFEKKK